MIKFSDYLKENRERAERLLDQLAHVNTQRGATQGEHDAARAKEKSLRAKYNIHPLDIPHFLKRSKTIENLRKK